MHKPCSLLHLRRESRSAHLQTSSTHAHKFMVPAALNLSRCGKNAVSSVTVIVVNAKSGLSFDIKLAINFVSHG